MKAIVTGARGTVGSVLCRRLRDAGHVAVPWDRAKTPIDDYAAMEAFVRESGANVIFHLAIASKPTGRENEGHLVNMHWTGEIAWIARQLGIGFVYVSTTMVFTDRLPGPFTPETPPDEREGYGWMKREAELRVLEQYPDARIARIGWQIGALPTPENPMGETPSDNYMILQLNRQMAENGVVRASTEWLPATSFLEDTADALIAVAEMENPGAPRDVFLINSNARWNFHEIVVALNKALGSPWKVEATQDHTHDQRMIDPRVPIASLDQRLDLI